MSRRAVKATRLAPSDALGEAVSSIIARPGRAILACVGTSLGATWFVALLGLTSTASAQVAADFTTRLATALVVTRPQPGGGSRGVATQGQQDGAPGPNYPYPANVQQRLDALPGVLAAGVFWQLTLGEPARAAEPSLAGRRPAPGLAGDHPAAGGPPVIAASPGFLAAARVKVSAGRTFGTWDQARAVPACLVGELAAKSLGISGLRRRPAILINQVTCVVIGIIGHVGWRQSILRSVLLPSSAAIALWGPPDGLAGARAAVLIRIRPGTAAVVAREAPYAISPARPRQFLVSVPPAPLRLGELVDATLSAEFWLLAWLGLVIGGLAIAAVTMIGVLPRAAEFGLRRAVGARRRHIAAQVVTESAILGLIGGLAGTSLGVAVVVIAAYWRNWAPVIEPKTVLYAPLVAAAAVVLAGLLACVPCAWIAPARTLNMFGIE